MPSEFTPSSRLERFLMWAPGGLGVLLGAFLIVLALDAFQSTNGVLAIAYAAFAAGRVSWMLVVSAPLVITGAMFLLVSRFRRPA